MKETDLIKSSGLGINPVPIDQTGSYAIIKFDLFLIDCKPFLICLAKT